MTRIMYVECCADFSHRGRARICRVRFSQTGRSLYVGKMQLHRSHEVVGNYVNRQSGIAYWVSGPKKNGGDRHWVGGGPVFIEPDVALEYWQDIRQCVPPKNPYLA